MWEIIQQDISHHNDFEKNYNIIHLWDTFSHDSVIIVSHKKLDLKYNFPNVGDYSFLHYKQNLINRLKVVLGKLHFKLLSRSCAVTYHKADENGWMTSWAKYEELINEKYEFMEKYCRKLRTQNNWNGVYRGPHELKFVQNVSRNLTEKKDFLLNIFYRKVPGGWKLFTSG